MSFELQLFLIIYGVLSMSHLCVQYFFAHRHAERHKAKSYDFTTRVVVLVPIYNESPWRLRRCLTSLRRQTHRNLHIVAIDDGSKNRKQLQWVYEEFGKFSNVSIELLAKNAGKREAQHRGYLNHPDATLYLTVDSDTVLASDAVAVMAARFADSRIGAVTADVTADNWRHSWLTRLIKVRYWSAFHVERAAQSYFNSVTCCSGPLSMYRGAALQKVWDKYIGQTFLGRPCTFGDDRHLTNLILREGFQAIFEPMASARTHVPERLFPDYVKQQWRWNMSFYREMLWNVTYLRNHHPYMAYDLAMQALLPFMLLAGLCITAIAALHGHEGVAFWYGLTALGMGLLRSIYGVWRTKDRNFLFFTVYGLLHVTVLIPLRIYSLITLFARRTAWGTR
ncbi:MAG TPA: glycosyltransferase [Candidatus Saccharimonadales bacterium]|nr:glycosyltransferase [Candidatus Saccharimonadales bacterium]